MNDRPFPRIAGSSSYVGPPTRSSPTSPIGWRSSSGSSVRQWITWLIQAAAVGAFVLLLIMGVTGCETPPRKTSSTTPAPTLAEPVAATNTAADGIVVEAQASDAAAKRIDAQADTLEPDAPQRAPIKADAGEIQQRQAEVERLAGAVKQHQATIAAKQAAIDAVAAERDAAQGSAAALQARVDELETRARSLDGRLLGWLRVAGLIAIAGGVLLGVNGGLKAGIGLAGSGIALFGVAGWIARYGWLIDLAVWGLLGVAVAFVGWQIYRKRRDIGDQLGLWRSTATTVIEKIEDAKSVDDFKAGWQVLKGELDRTMGPAQKLAVEEAVRFKKQREAA